jgi:hypothetical protein
MDKKIPSLKDMRETRYILSNLGNLDHVKKPLKKVEALPPIGLNKQCVVSETLFERSDTKMSPRKRVSYMDGDKKGKISFNEHRLDRLTQADELPLGLALKLARDVIRMERRIKEQTMMEEIRRKRKEYELQKRKTVNERLARFNKGISVNTSRRGFSYFPLFENKQRSGVTSNMLKNHKYYETTVNQDRFSVNKKTALDKMREFGQRHKHANESRCQNYANEVSYLSER